MRKRVPVIGLMAICAFTTIGVLVCQKVPAILLRDSRNDILHSQDGAPLDGDAFIRRTEQIGEAVRSSAFSTQAGQLSISVSVGAITIDPLTACAPIELLLARADEALYRAKAMGRDRAIFADPLVISPLGEKPRSVPLFQVV